VKKGSSIRRKLQMLVLLTSLLAVTVSGLIFLFYDLNAYREGRLSDMESKLALVAYASIPALQFGDEAAAAANLESLRIRESVSAAALFDRDGNLFAEYSRSGEPLSFPLLAPGENFSIQGESLFFYQPLFQNGESVGTAFIQADYLGRQRVLNFMATLLAVTAGALLVASLLSTWLQAGIIGPIIAIANIARQVVSYRDYSQRARKQTDDEVGMLVDDFNDMLNEIENRTNALEKSNSELEQEVVERKRAREEVLRLNEALKTKIEQLNEADRHKDDFLATLAHELRNPLAPIRSGLEVLSRSDDAGRAAIYAILERQTNQLIHLVDELMDVSRISRGKVMLQPRAVELQGVIQAAIEATRDLMVRKQHQFEVHLPEHTVMIYADPVRLTQVVLNLLTNAAHYTPIGGRVILEARVQHGTLEVSVQDNGIGMEPAMLERIFEAFVQVESPMTRSRTESGLGVGLTLARALVTMHGGNIRAESAGVGQGTRFIVTMPLGISGNEPVPDAARPQSTAPVPGPLGDEPHAVPAALHAELPETEPPVAEPLTTESPTGLRVMVVDDNQDAAMMLTMLLQLNGHQVETRHSGRAALDLGQEYHPEVMLLDLGMPGMNGIETAKAIRKTDWGASVILVAVTGWGQEEDKRITREAGFDHHLVKPVEASSLLQLLNGMVTGRSTEPALRD
jgi:signal transduction histidine kinase/CheY-like chemotaxis protein